jgi:hypothetical protein
MTGKPLKMTGLKREYVSKLIDLGVLYVNKYSQIHVNKLAFLKRAYTVPQEIYDQMTDPEYGQFVRASQRGLTLEQYKGRDSWRKSDERKKALRDPYRGRNKEIISGDKSISADILFPDAPIEKFRRCTVDEDTENNQNRSL